MTQKDMVYDYIMMNGSITQFEAFTLLGESRLSARVFELNKMQDIDKSRKRIVSEIIKVRKANGDWVHVAKYSFQEDK